MGRGRDRAGLLVLLVAEIAAVAGLHRLGSVDGLGVPWGSLGTWVRTAPPEEVVGALLCAGALGLASWLLLSTVLCVAAGLAGAPRAVRVLAATALPSVRRLVQRAVAVTVVAGSAIGVRPALADPPPTGTPDSQPVLAIDHRGARPATSTPTSTRPASTPTARSGRSGGLESVPTTPSPAPPPATAPAPEPAPTASTVGASYVVGPGDSLWSIAATHLARRTGRAPADVADVEVAPYWVAVVAANRDRLQSGDPNLIYPGEALELPPVG